MDATQEPTAGSKPENEPSPDAASTNRRSRRRGLIVSLGTLLIAAAFFLGLHYLAFNFTHETTDDAFIDGPIVAIAPKVAGQVKSVFVVANQPVKAGDPLIEIEPQDFEAALGQKSAALTAAQANVELLVATFGMLKAQVDAAEATARQSEAQAVASAATARRAELDLQRAQELIGQKTISPAEFDSAKATAEEAKANLKAAQEQTASDQAKVTQNNAELTAARKAVERADALKHQSDVDVQTAKLNLSYTHVVAPQAGWVTRKSVEKGDYLQVGQRIMALVSKDVWVTANFKETQLGRLRVGQPVEISVDSLDGRKFRGHVESIQAGSGARFSLLPPENAVGNYVKVVQRVPVRIFFDEPIESSHVLGPGMSVVPAVRVKAQSFSDATIALAAAVLALIVGVGWWRLARRKAEAAGNETHGGPAQS